MFQQPLTEKIPTKDLGLRMVKDFPFIRQPELVAQKAGNVSVADRQKFFEHT